MFIIISVCLCNQGEERNSMMFAWNIMQESIGNCSLATWKHCENIQVHLLIFRFMPCAVWWEWRIRERTLRLPEWLEGARVWCSRRTMHWPNMLWPWHLHHGSLHLCTRIQRRNLWGRSEPHFDLLLQAFLSLKWPRCYSVLRLKQQHSFVSNKCSTCSYYIEQRAEIRELVPLVTVTVTALCVRLYLLHSQSCNEKCSCFPHF